MATRAPANYSRLGESRYDNVAVITLYPSHTVCPSSLSCSFNALTASQVLKVNATELRELMRVTAPSLGDVPALARACCVEHGIPFVAVTDGPRKAVLAALKQGEGMVRVSFVNVSLCG